MKKSIVAFMLATVALAPRARSQSPDAVIDHAVSAWAKVHTVRASFDQTLTNPLTGSSAQAHGEFQQERPNKLSVVFTGGDGDRVIADGRYLWVYLPGTTPGQVIRRRATDAATDAPIDLSAQFLDAPHARFRITSTGKASVDGKPATELTLVTKPGARAPFARAKVWVTDSDGLIRQFETEEKSGVTRRITLTSLAINGSVDASAFRFVAPRGVKVVDE